MKTHFLENKINNDDISIEESSRTALLISKVKPLGGGRWEFGRGGGELKYGFMDITLLPWGSSIHNHKPVIYKSNVN